MQSDHLCTGSWREELAVLAQRAEVPSLQVEWPPLRPGDTLILRTLTRLTDAERAHLKAVLAGWLDKRGVAAIVLPPSLQVERAVTGAAR